MERKLNDQEIARRNKLKTLIDMGLDPYKIEKFDRNVSCSQFVKKYESCSKEELHDNTDEIKIAGRVMAIRQTFGLIRDYTGKLQFYLNKKEVSEETLKVFKECLDIGDVIAITGTPFKTNTGECTVKIKDFKIVSKCLKPLPEKWHGLEDDEIRARKRYLDLIVNKESFETFSTRSKIIASIREYMNSVGHTEVETPVLQGILGGAAARPFITHHNTLDREYYLRIATELPLKRLIVGGFDKVYEIGRIFRNEGMDTTHNPEFTTIEAYEAYTNMEDMMDRVEGIFKHVAKAIGKEKLSYKDVSIDFTKPFRRISMIDIIKESCGIDFKTIKTDTQALKLAKEHNIELKKHENTLGHVMNAFFETYGEEKCLEPTFVFGHPIAVSPLAKKDFANDGATRRFELFICKKEYANAFSELNDPFDQYERFEEQMKEKHLGNVEANEMDYDFIEALEYGLPPTGGLGLGVDRMVMLFTQKDSIRDVLLFPHMREKNE